MVSKTMVSELLVTNVQRFSTNDGPGIRTTVFLKGCPLRCTWCHNPECINSFEEFYYIELKCVRCGHCAEICPEGAITPPGPDGEPPERDRDKCIRCMRCVDECLYGGLERVGKSWTIDEIIEEVMADELFYKNSDGGMTVSGGEPLFHPEFTAELLRRAKEAGLHTCLDTSGFAKWEVLEKVLPYVDLVLFDIKCMDLEKHREVTGVPNDIILSNARKIAEMGNKMRIRLPIIPGINQEVEFIEEVANFARELGDAVEGIDILPFHNWAGGKYEQLDERYAFGDMDALPPEDMKDFEKILKGYGFEVTVGG